MIYIYISLTAAGLTSGGSSTAHIYTQTVHKIQQYITLYTQTVHTIQQYSTHLHTNTTHNTAVQHTFTHKQYTQYSSTAHIYTQIVHTIHRTEHTYQFKKIVKCEPCPVFPSYTLAFTLRLREKQGNPSFSVVEKCPDILVAVL
jgi:hypothetical protein